MMLEKLYFALKYYIAMILFAMVCNFFYHADRVYYRFDDYLPNMYFILIFAAVITVPLLLFRLGDWDE